MIFRRKHGATDSVATAPREDPASVEQLRAEIEELRQANAERRDPDVDRRILRLRHLAGIRMLGGSDSPAVAEPDFEGLDQTQSLPEIDGSELTAERLRGAILSHGCLLVRGLVPRAEAEAMVEEIDRALASWEASQAEARSAEPGYYEEFAPEAGFGLVERQWVNSAGGIWAADSPRLMCDVIDTFERANLNRIGREYLGQDPLISVQKCTLRKVDPSAGRGWHQDGAFLGDVSALNVWLSLSHCGDQAPGLDIIPRRFEETVPTGTEGATFDWSVAEDVAREAAGETPILRPIFEPGDVLLFDDLFLHTTAAEPEMPNPRYAVESWFFGAAAFPKDYVPIAP